MPFSTVCNVGHYTEYFAQLDIHAYLREDFSGEGNGAGVVRCDYGDTGSSAYPFGTHPLAQN